MDNFKCGVCQNTVGNTSFMAREMMFGLREQFLYFKCSLCGCLQIAELPPDMRPYYPAENYYSYKSSQSKISIKTRLGFSLRTRVLANYLNKSGKLNLQLTQLLLQKKEFKWITQLKGLSLSSDILDVGSGTGVLLSDLNKLGFKNLTGIDPFIEKDIHYPNGVNVLKQDITAVDKQYDLVMLNHVFEHMDNPNDTFKQLFNLIKPNGWLLIRIPVVDCFSWRKYGVSWFQLDAPRHFYLHTVRSMSILGENNGLDLLNVEYDSNESQFYQSEKYIRDKSLLEKVYFKPTVLKKWKKFADWLNSTNDGDQACFIFSKKSNNQ